MTNIIENDITMPSTSSGTSHVNYRVMYHSKEENIWYERSMFTIREKPNWSRGLKSAYLGCFHSGCKVTCKTTGIDTLV